VDPESDEVVAVPSLAFAREEMAALSLHAQALESPAHIAIEVDEAVGCILLPP
jgi:hypothetical protein